MLGFCIICDPITISNYREKIRNMIGTSKLIKSVIELDIPSMWVVVMQQKRSG